MPDTNARTDVFKTVVELASANPLTTTESTTLKELDIGEDDDLLRIELTLDLEDEYGIIIEDEDMDNWKTVGDVVDHIMKANGLET